MKRLLFFLIAVSLVGSVFAGGFSAGAGWEWGWPSAPGVIRVDAYKPEFTIALQGQTPAVRIWIDETGQGRIELTKGQPCNNE